MDQKRRSPAWEISAPGNRMESTASTTLPWHHRDANSRTEIFRRLDVFKECFTLCARYPERLREAVWHRTDADPKKSISITPLEKKGDYPPTFAWYDFKVGKGFVARSA